MDRYIILQNKRFTYYDTFDSFREAKLVADYHKKLDGNKYYILTIEKGGLIPHRVYRLYMNRIIGRIL